MSRNLEGFMDLIRQSKNIAIISHQTPDADAFGSAMALREIIKKFYTTTPEGKRTHKRVDVFLDMESLPKSLEIFVPQNGKMDKYLNPAKHPKKYQLAIALDCASLERMGKYQEIFNNAQNTINIDHHATNTRFAEQNYVMKTSSTSEALFYLFLHKRVKEASKYTLSLLYTGILTDTNNLKNNADSLGTEKAVSVIKQTIGINLANRLRANFFENNSAARDILNGYAYSRKHRKYYAEDKLCVIVLPNKAFKTAKAQLEDAEGIVDEALHRKGLLVSAIVLEAEKNSLYVKLRGKPGVDVSLLAKQFGGGGHVGQAAFQYKGSINSLMREFLPKAQEFVQAAQEQTIEICQELFQ